MLVNPVLVEALSSDNYFHNCGSMVSFGEQVYAIIGNNGNYERL